MFEMLIVEAVVARVVGGLHHRWGLDDPARRGRGDRGAGILETVLIAGAFAALAIGAMVVITTKVMARAHGIDGGDTPPPTSIPQ